MIVVSVEIEKSDSVNEFDDGNSTTSSPIGGARVLLVAQLARLVTQAVSITILSRLISPNSFGILALASVVIGIVNVLGDLGLSIAVIRAPAITRGEWNNIWWLNFAIGLLLGSTLIVIAPLLARTYSEPVLSPIMRVLALTFVVTAASIQHRADLVRRSKFVPLAVAETVSPFIGLVVAIVMATMNTGPWALVGQQVGTALALTITIWCINPVRLRLPDRGSNVSSFLKFGLAANLGHLMAYVSTAAAPAALGMFWPPSLVGAYSRASTLAAMPLANLGSPLTRAVVPFLASKASTDQFDDAVIKAQSTLVYLVGPLVAVVGGLAGPIVNIVLGNSFADSGPILTVLAIGVLFTVCQFAFFWTFLALGRSSMLIWTEIPGRVVSVALILFWADRGVIWVSSAVTIGALAILVGSLVGLLLVSSLNGKLIISSTIRGLVILSAILGGCYAISHYADSFPSVLQILFGLLWAGVVVGFGCLLSRQVLRNFKDGLSVAIKALKIDGRLRIRSPKLYRLLMQ